MPREKIIENHDTQESTPADPSNASSPKTADQQATSADPVTSENPAESTAGSNRDEDRSLRPKIMQEMVGQSDVKEQLRIVVDAARRRDEALRL